MEIKPRNHFYTYSVGIRTLVTVPILNKHGKDTGETETVTQWPATAVKHCANMHEVAGKLKLRLDDIRYEGKVIE